MYTTPTLASFHHLVADSIQIINQARDLLTSFNYVGPGAQVPDLYPNPG